MEKQRDFRQRVQELRIEPSAASWKRLESKLDAHAAHTRVRRLRVLGYAATLLIVVLAGIAITSINTKPNPEAGLYTMSIETLSEEDVRAGSIYDIEKVKGLTNVWTR